jgi:hypothetical protein
VLVAFLLFEQFNKFALFGNQDYSSSVINPVQQEAAQISHPAGLGTKEKSGCFRKTNPNRFNRADSA